MGVFYDVIKAGIGEKKKINITKRAEDGKDSIDNILCHVLLFRRYPGSRAIVSGAIPIPGSWWSRLVKQPPGRLVVAERRTSQLLELAW